MEKHYQTIRGVAKLGKFGVEIETGGPNKFDVAERLRENGINCIVEGYNHNRTNHWKIVSDASVHVLNPFELVSPILEGQAGLDELKTVCRVLNDLNAKVDKSCGLHVHHDASDWNENTLDRFIDVYRKMEKTIDKFMPKSRRGNNGRYCKSLIGKANSEVRNGRFHKVNLQAYYRHGTIEFRHHGGTTEFKKIENWILFTCLITRRAHRGVNWNVENLTWCRTKRFMGVDVSEITGKTLCDELKSMVNFFNGRIQHFAQLERI